MTGPTPPEPLFPPASLSLALADETVPLPPEVDLKELAKEVFKLMQEDLRRERERQGRP